MQRIISALILSIFTFITVQAEIGVSAGARAGFNISTLRKFEAAPGYKKRISLGSDIAGVLRLDFNKFISLQAEIEFTQKGQGWKYSIDSAKYSGKHVVNYVQFPILAVGRFGSEKVKGIIQLGPYVSYWTGGYTQHSVSIDKQTKNAVTEKKVFTTSDMRVDVGLVAGAGADIKIGKGWIEVAARYNAGFLSLSKKSSVTPKIYTSSFSISVGYLYIIKEKE